MILIFLFIDNPIVGGGDFGDTYCVCSIQYIKLLTFETFQTRIFAIEHLCIMHVKIKKEKKNK